MHPVDQILLYRYTIKMLEETKWVSIVFMKLEKELDNVYSKLEQVLSKS